MVLQETGVVILPNDGAQGSKYVGDTPQIYIYIYMCVCVCVCVCV